MWIGLLLRFWKPFAGALLILAAGWFLHHRGYESGYAASEAKWRPRFSAAERELAAANARTEMKEAESTRAAAESQRRIDETQQTLHARTVDYDSRLRALSVRYAAAAARRCDLPEAAGSPTVPDAAAQSEQRASEAGGSIAATGADCELDAATVAEWQRFYTGVRSTINQTE